jgi:hypothetical protein
MILVRKPERMRPLRKPRCRRVDSLRFSFLVSLGGLRLSPRSISVLTIWSGLLYQPQMMDDDCGAVSGMSSRETVDDIKIDCRELGWGGMDWIDLTHDKDQWRELVITLMKLWIP